MTKQEIIGMNIVIVNNQIDTNLFSQYWFIENKIFEPDEILPGSVFIPGLSNVVAADSQLIVTPQNIQFVVKANDMYKSYEIVKKRFLKFAEVLPMIPVKALGINLAWKICDDARDVHTLSKELFYKDDDRFYSLFDKDNARYGAYLSQNYDSDTRLKLDIKPVIAQSGQLSEEFILASFNYHRDLTTMKWKDNLIEQIKKWSNIISNSKKIVCLLT